MFTIFEAKFISHKIILCNKKRSELETLKLNIDCLNLIILFQYLNVNENETEKNSLLMALNNERKK